MRKNVKINELSQLCKKTLKTIVIGILAWPYILVATAIDMLRGED